MLSTASNLLKSMATAVREQLELSAQHDEAVADVAGSGEVAAPHLAQLTG